MPPQRDFLCEHPSQNAQPVNHPSSPIDVAKGFHQRLGMDYHDTFSLVVKPTTIRLLDINNAFHQGHLSEDVYMAQSPGFVDRDNPTHVYDITIYLLVYVDDIIITDTNTNIIQRYIDLLAQRFSIKDLSALSYFLSIEVLTTSSDVFLTQRRYISDLLPQTKMSGAKLVATPLVTDGNLTLHPDADWVGNKDDYTSTSAYIVYLGRHPISWSSKKQYSCSIIHRGEYQSIVVTTSKINWICSLLIEFGITLPTRLLSIVTMLVPPISSLPKLQSRLASPPKLHLEGAY
ncbi:hypothetical protein AAG906_039096 [Vitis piasezkii]